MVNYRPKSKFYGIFSQFDGVPVKYLKNVETEKHTCIINDEIAYIRNFSSFHVSVKICYLCIIGVAITTKLEPKRPIGWKNRAADHLSNKTKRKLFYISCKCILKHKYSSGLRESNGHLSVLLNHSFWSGSHHHVEVQDSSHGAEGQSWSRQEGHI